MSKDALASLRAQLNAATAQIERLQLQLAEAITRVALLACDPAVCLPASDQVVLAVYLEPLYQRESVRCTVRAQYVAPLSRRLAGGDGDSVYDEETDEYYWVPGWYEWNEQDDVHYFIERPILMWAPLPTLELNHAG